MSARRRRHSRPSRHNRKLTKITVAVAGATVMVPAAVAAGIAASGGPSGPGSALVAVAGPRPGANPPLAGLGAGIPVTAAARAAVASLAARRARAAEQAAGRRAAELKADRQAAELLADRQAAEQLADQQAAAQAASASGSPTQPAVRGLVTAAQVRAMLSAALSRLGMPYVWGAAGPRSFDCSGLVQWSFAQAGIVMPRVADDQARTGPSVPASDLQAGDLLFYHTDRTAPGYISHVAIYLGNGKMIQAPEPGQFVEIVPVDLGSGFAGAVDVSPRIAAKVAAASA